MAKFSNDTVFFYDKTTELNTLTKYIDMLLTIWCCLDDLGGRVAKEVKYLKEQRNIDTFEEEDDETPSLFYMSDHNNLLEINAPDTEKLLRYVIKKVEYKINLSAMQRLNGFLESLLDKDNDWRENNTKLWVLTGSHYEDIFRLMVWMIAELKEIIKSYFKEQPTETNVLLLLNDLRTSCYKLAKSLDSLAFDSGAFNKALGTSDFVVSPIYSKFWETIDHDLDKAEDGNPINQYLERPTLLIQIFGKLTLGIECCTKINRRHVASFIYYKSLIYRLNDIEKAWSMLLRDYFFLGPTKELLLATRVTFSEALSVIGQTKDDTPKEIIEHHKSIQDFVSKFDRASECLITELQEIVDNRSK